MDPEARKKALKMISYGLYVATARGGDDTAAATVTWVTQMSFEPPLVAMGVKLDSQLYRAILRGNTFALNMLGDDQADIAAKFFKPAQVEDGKLGGYAISEGVTGAPLLDDAPAIVECKVTDEVDRGDHVLFLGEVVDVQSRREARPLDLYRDTKWSYGG
ncbi:MAG: flavin reductase family protein [Planctomycetota bacterium]